MPNWTTSDIPSQTGRIAVITGATGGLGYETSLGLARAGANVILTGRNASKGEVAMEQILRACPQASVRYMDLDLASLGSVREFAKRFASEYGVLDLLVNNAGVMTPPKRYTTADGFELQFGTNFLSHFALTARLIPSLRAAQAPRVVNLSSIAHRTFAAIHFDDLQSMRHYRPWRAYAQSKLAMLMFAIELQRRSDSHGWGLVSVAAHPGYARTDLIANGPGDTWMQRINAVTFEPLLSQSATRGALSSLLAATSPDVEPGCYYGPTGPFELKGTPGKVHISHQAKDRTLAARLWEVSCGLTNTWWPEQQGASAETTEVLGGAG